ncbi:hypothetical protein I9W82_002799 [Candida metapsilosis]|uniref:Uncharacterized protein n=1 Tax=Candida metapsilosis TaxID=273372 RepID=A0A8H8DBA4_9ASCO|nr:hypothetical protein I9W82_002799 [Candida metapsilosis]
MRLKLDLYQLDILQNVFSYVEVKEITQLLNEPFLLHNCNIKNAIHHTLTRGYSYHHQTSRNYGVNKGYPDMRVQDPSSLSREQYELTETYCVEQQIQTTSKISYGLCHMVDLLDLLELIRALQPSDTVPLVFELDFGYAFKLDMNKFMELFEHISDRIVMLTMKFQRLQELDGDVTFKNLEVFNSHLCRVSSFNCPKMKKLSFNVLDGYDVCSLPTVQMLRLVCSGWLSEDTVESSNIIEGSRNIKIQGEYKKDIDEALIKSIIKYADAGTTIDCLKRLDENVFELLVKAVKEERCILRSIFIERPISQLEVYPCYSLELCNVRNLSVLMKLPSTLKVLKVSLPYVGTLEVNDLLDLLPIGLETLKISDDYRMTCDGFLDLSRFHSLRKLILLVSFMDYVKETHLPDSVEELYLTCHAFTICEVKFPERLKSMKLTGVYGPRGTRANLNGVQFPSTLKQVELWNNRIVAIDLSNVERLEKLTLYRTEFEGLKLPDVDALSFEYCEKVPESYCGGAEQYLCFRGCNLEKMKLKLGFCLKYLVLSNCNLSKFDVDLPDCLEEIDLSHNNLTEFPVQLSNLTNLRLLHVADNRIHNGCIEFQTCSIEALDLSCNSIEEIKLTFPGPTKLMYLALHGNKIREISDESIGSHPRLFHVELDKSKAFKGYSKVKLPNATAQKYFEEWEISGPMRRE